MKLQRRLQLIGCNIEARWMAVALKVAFATSDMQRVDQHFGAARLFAIYALDQQHISLVEANEFSQLEMDGNEDKLADRVNVLQGCIAIYCQALGASAISQLQAKGIRPVKVPSDTLIGDMLVSLQNELKQGTNNWLARAIARGMPANSARFDQMDAEGWQE